MVVVQGDAELLEVILALRARGGLAHPLHRGHQQPDQYRDDRDDDEQLHQGESTAVVMSHGGLLGRHGHGEAYHKHSLTVPRGAT